MHASVLCELDMWFYRLLTPLLLVLCAVLCTSQSENELKLVRHSLGRRSLNLASREKSPYKYKTKYFEVPVDHFNFDNQDVFNMKYLINEDYFSPDTGAPIFFYTGNEGNIELFADNTGFLWEAAQEFKALIVFAEHRYYGSSMPYGNKSFDDPKYWGYLTVEQAMADFIDLIVHLRSQYQNHSSKRIPVIAFGGSYGGMLSAWIRMKYPAEITGALAASAPIWGFPSVTSDCGTFNRILTSAYRLAARNCPTNVRRIWSELEKQFKTPNGRDWLNKNWQLCPPLKNESEYNELTSSLMTRIVDVAMANYPYPSTFLGALPGYPVKKFCKHLAEDNLHGTELLSKTFEGLKEWFNYTKDANCFKWAQDPTPDLGLTGWNYQSCEQMILPDCVDDKGDIFEPAPWNLDEYMKDCEDKYHRKPRPYFIAKQYGGKHIKDASNIIFSNGLLDPWSGEGVTANVSENIAVVLIPEGAHHLDLRASNKLDPESVIKARKFYKQLFRKWIKEFS